MGMGMTPEFIRTEIEQQSYEISINADNERLADGLTVFQLEEALSDCTVIERYPDDPRGESCLVVGLTHEGLPIHIVCGRNPARHLILITVYIPTMPKWKDPYTRNR
jgi:hypothetical protein